MFPIQTVRVVDGDTVEVDVHLGMDTVRRTKIRLADIDTPERFTPRGKKATAFTTSWLRGKTLEVEDLGDDKYGGRRDGIIRDVLTSTSLGATLRDAGLEKVK